MEFDGKACLDHYDDVGNSLNMSQWAAELYLLVPHNKHSVIKFKHSINLKSETKQEYNDLPL